MTHPSIFSLDRTRETPSDGVETATLSEQRETELIIDDQLLPQGTGLKTNEHIQWLADKFFKDLPAGFRQLDASRPWLVFWIIHSIDLLGAPMDPKSRER